MIKVGDIAPNFCLPDQNGTLRHLRDFLRDKVVVLYFYPRDETSGCVTEACGFRDTYEDFVAAGAEVIGVSIDTVQSHKEFIAHHQLPFVLLSDPDMRVHIQYGADSAFFGLMRARVTFVIDQKGIVRYVFNSQVQARRHVRESLAALKKIKAMALR